VFRISRRGQEPIVDVEFEEDIEPVIRTAKPGRYHVDEIRAHGDPFPSGHTSRAWGKVIHQPDGRVALKPYFHGDHVPAGED
jgi:hypothetical protein